MKVFSVKVTERPDTRDLSEEEPDKNEEYFGMTVQEITPEIAVASWAAGCNRCYHHSG